MRGTRFEWRRSCCGAIGGSIGCSICCGLGGSGILKMLSKMPIIGCVLVGGIVGAV